MLASIALHNSHRRTRGGGGLGVAPPPPLPRFFQIAIFGQKACNIREKPLDIRASNGDKIRATDLSPPKTKLVPYAYDNNDIYTTSDCSAVKQEKLILKRLFCIITNDVLKSL